eukprot:4278722-Pyramimonas_sp.AAC.2
MVAIGSSTSFAELLELAPVISVSWIQKRKEEREKQQMEVDRPDEEDDDDEQPGQPLAKKPRTQAGDETAYAKFIKGAPTASLDLRTINVRLASDQN